MPSPRQFRRGTVLGVLLASTSWLTLGQAAPAESSEPSLWSLQPVRTPSLPEVRNTSWPRTPIDTFILAALESRGLSPAPEADARTLIRRVAFDLTGLPPTPEQVDAFAADSRPDAYERMVDQFLASPQYGERWARHWLDLARFTESQGFEYDHMRENAWPYRDYVIRSFNEDKPYDVFVREQVAGDVLEPMTRDSIAATGFLVGGPWDQAGSSQANLTERKAVREEELEDMISAVGQTFLGLTVNCARCHAHKFDPIPQEDYYRIKSVFEGVRHGQRPLLTPAESKARDEAIAAINRRIRATESEAGALEWAGRKAWLAANLPPKELAPDSPRPLAQWSFAVDGCDSVGSMHAELGGGATISGGRLHLNGKDSFARSAPLPLDLTEKTLSVWVSLANLDQQGGGVITLEAASRGPFDSIVLGERTSKRWLAGSEFLRRSKDLPGPLESSRPGEWIHLAAVYGPGDWISLYRNGELYAEGYTPEFPLPTYEAGKAHVLFGWRHTGAGNGWLAGEIAEASLYSRALSETEVAVAYNDSAWRVSAADWLGALPRSERERYEQLLSRLTKARAELKAASELPMTYAGAREQPEPTRRLRRGNVRTPLEVVRPGGLSAVKELESDWGLAADAPEAERRRRFAQWLTDSRNPLTSRVAVNRLWQHHFGQGIVATPSDFGASGSGPSHPELLDWLAGLLVEQHWSLKALHRVILSSAAYRQSSAFQPKAAEIDTENRLVWRFTPRRLEGEALRDAMLAAGGELNLVVGGPSFRPFDTESFNATFYILKDKIGPEYNRRTVYRMNVNSGRDPLLESFDCPDPSVKTPRRGVTTTPLQALSLMNNSFVYRQAAHLAGRVEDAAGGDLGRAINRAYRLCYGRAATARELERASAVAKEAGLLTVCWALLNATEFLYVH